MLVVAAVLTAEVPDTSGEILLVKGADISALQTGLAPVNTEHHNPEDVKLHEKDFGGFSTIIGRVINAKKIFSAEDCENDYELAAWNRLQVPLIFGYIEFFDGPHAHENAKAAAALVRMGAQKGSDFMLRFSVEGEILKRKGDVLTDTVIKRIAATAKPANKVAQIEGVVVDEKVHGLVKSELKSLSPFVPYHVLQYNGLSMLKLSHAVDSLKKALTAGNVNMPPSGLVNGAALAKQNGPSASSSTSSPNDIVYDLLAKIKNKPLTRDLLREYFPKAKEEQLDKVLSVLKRHRFAMYEDAAKKAYESLQKIKK